MPITRLRAALPLLITLLTAFAPILSAPPRAIAAAPALAAVTVGNYFSCALTEGGAAKCWGANASGQLGASIPVTTDASTRPVDVVGLSSGVRAIAAGDSHACAITGTGGLKCWGNNSYGQLGDGSTTNRNAPVDVSGLTSGVTAVVAGAAHTCAIISAGGLKCWGMNDNGQLGDGTYEQRNTPVSVLGHADGVSVVGTWGQHACAIRNSNVRCWGLNSVGQLGRYSTSPYSSPTPEPVFGLGQGSVVSHLAVGYEHNCVINAGVGKTQCWGSNYVGELANGSSVYINPAPLVIDNLAGAQALKARGRCAIFDGFRAKCWGPNGAGQVGNTNPNINTRVPVDVDVLPAGQAVLDIDVSGTHGCAVSAATVYCWGDNAYGQLGDGTRTSRRTAAPVVIPTPPSFTSGTPPNSTYGNNYQHTFRAEGAPAPQFSLLSGTLPPGLTLSQGGLLSGVPRQAGSYSFVVKATTGYGDDAVQSVTILIARAPLSVTAPNPSRAYGAPNPPLMPTVTGLVAGDTVASALSGSLATLATLVSPVGAYLINQGTLAAANYEIAFTGGTLTITKAQLTVTANSFTIPQGQPIPALTVTISDFVNGEGPSVVSGSPACTTTATQSSPVGSYPISCDAGTLTAINYAFSFQAGTLTILAPGVSIDTISAQSGGHLLLGGRLIGAPTAKIIVEASGSTREARQIVYTVQASGERWSLNTATAIPDGANAPVAGFAPGTRLQVNAQATDGSAMVGAPASVGITAGFNVYIPLIQR